ncbi:phage integrase N-terminal SAM-like domain-containing protein [Amphibiibacter pelophylacis]|uniref:phage integrase N-terminal SAM-like domain-containing protein n=1 Tax=Amphibiibacter pelophylacis TaxID=1799477 RepID=UPI003BFA70F8
MTPAAEPQRPKLLDQLRGKLRVMHYSLRTEKKYVQWAIRFILFHNKAHLEQVAAINFPCILTWLACQLPAQRALKSNESCFWCRIDSRKTVSFPCAYSTR